MCDYVALEISSENNISPIILLSIFAMQLSSINKLTCLILRLVEAHQRIMKRTSSGLPRLGVDSNLTWRLKSVLVY